MGKEEQIWWEMWVMERKKGVPGRRFRADGRGKM